METKSNSRTAIPDWAIKTIAVLTFVVSLGYGIYEGFVFSGLVFELYKLHTMTLKVNLVVVINYPNW